MGLRAAADTVSPGSRATVRGRSRGLGGRLGLLGIQELGEAGSASPPTSRRLCSAPIFQVIVARGLKAQGALNGTMPTQKLTKPGRSQSLDVPRCLPFPEKPEWGVGRKGACLKAANLVSLVRALVLRQPFRVFSDLGEAC